MSREAWPSKGRNSFLWGQGAVAVVIGLYLFLAPETWFGADLSPGWGVGIVAAGIAMLLWSAGRTAQAAWREDGAWSPRVAGYFGISVILGLLALAGLALLVLRLASI